VDSRDLLLILLDDKQAHHSTFACLTFLPGCHYANCAVEAHRSVRCPVDSQAEASALNSDFQRLSLLGVQSYHDTKQPHILESAQLNRSFASETKALFFQPFLSFLPWVELTRSLFESEHASQGFHVQLFSCFCLGANHSNVR
jgi:hypothetical protein